MLWPGDDVGAPGRNGFTTGPETVAAELASPTQALPTTGWVTGIFGRRDRLAFLLRHLAAIPAHHLVTLQTDNLWITDTGKAVVKITGKTPLVAESPGDDSVVSRVWPVAVVVGAVPGKSGRVSGDDDPYQQGDPAY